MPKVIVTRAFSLIVGACGSYDIVNELSESMSESIEAQFVLAAGSCSVAELGDAKDSVNDRGYCVLLDGAQFI